MVDRHQRRSIFRLRTNPEGKVRAAAWRPTSLLVPWSALGACRHGALSSFAAAERDISENLAKFALTPERAANLHLVVPGQGEVEVSEDKVLFELASPCDDLAVRVDDVAVAVTDPVGIGSLGT